MGRQEENSEDRSVDEDFGKVQDVERGDSGPKGHRTLPELRYEHNCGNSCQEGG